MYIKLYSVNLQVIILVCLVCKQFILVFVYIDVTVGFSAMSFVTTETDGHVNICVDILNPAVEGALKRFTVGLLPEPGMSVQIL